MYRNYEYNSEPLAQGSGQPSVPRAVKAPETTSSSSGLSPLCFALPCLAELPAAVFMA